MGDSSDAPIRGSGDRYCDSIAALTCEHLGQSTEAPKNATRIYQEAGGRWFPTGNMRQDFDQYLRHRAECTAASESNNVIVPLAEIVVLVVMALALAMSARQTVLALWVHFSSRAARIDALGSNFAVGEAPVADHRGDDWPTVHILVPAHNEERVIGDCLSAIVRFDYPMHLLKILVINDRSSDATGVIADRFASQYVNLNVLHRRPSDTPGKSAALADGIAQVNSEVIVLFDADYIPQPSLLRELVAPFSDPTVGATMGRVVPLNADANILTRLLDLERRAGYCVDQNGRNLLGLVPQFGGTVGGIRRSALEAVGGWKKGHLTEDTDLTFRLLLDGWRTAYLNHARCYEEVPETWQTRFKQVRRWAYGHNQCMIDYFVAVLRSPRLRFVQRLDALLILTFYLVPALALVSLPVLIAILAYWPDDSLVCYACSQLAPVLAVALLAPYLQIAIAAHRDGQAHVIRVAPLLVISSIISTLASSTAIALLIWNQCAGTTLAWDKTKRFRLAR